MLRSWPKRLGFSRVGDLGRAVEGELVVEEQVAAVVTGVTATPEEGSWSVSDVKYCSHPHHD